MVYMRSHCTSSSRNVASQDWTGSTYLFPLRREGVFRPLCRRKLRLG